MIAIIDYGVGNLFSLQSSLKFIGADAEVTNDIAKIKAADRIIQMCIRDRAYIAPKLFGGRTAKTPIEGQGVATPAEAFYLKNSKIIPLGEDFLIESEVSRDVHGNC